MKITTRGILTHQACNAVECLRLAAAEENLSLDIEYAAATNPDAKAVCRNDRPLEDIYRNCLKTAEHHALLLISQLHTLRNQIPVRTEDNDDEEEPDET